MSCPPPTMLFRILRPVTLASRPFLSTAPRRFIIPACARNLTTSAPTTDEPSSEPLDASAAAPEPEPKPEPASDLESEPLPPPRMPYFVGRNNLNNFGVYQKTKRGGNYKMTILKKAEGDLQALKRDIKDALDLDPSEISVNSVTGHIVLKGFKRGEVVTFLHTMRF